MFNNINTPVNPNFGANLRITIPVKDSSRLENIQKAFSAKTTEIKDTLSIAQLGKEWDNMECYYIGKNQDNAIIGSLKTSLDTMLETLSDNDIVTKLVKTLKAMKELNKKEIAAFGFENQKYRAEHEYKRNMLIAQDCREKGQEVMASRFEALAGIYGKKLQKIINEETQINNRFLERLNSIADGDEEILDLKNSI